MEYKYTRYRKDTIKTVVAFYRNRYCFIWYPVVTLMISSLILLFVFFLISALSPESSNHESIGLLLETNPFFIMCFASGIVFLISFCAVIVISWKFFALSLWITRYQPKVTECSFYFLAGSRIFAEKAEGTHSITFKSQTIY